MGRFYQTAEPTFISDKMFEAPSELMSQVLLGKDKQLDDEFETVQGIDDSLKADVLTQDSDRAKQIIQGHQDKIDSIRDTILKSPLDSLKHRQQIRELSRQVQNDWGANGVIGTMQGYKKRVTEEYDKLDKFLKDHPEEADYVAKEKQNILAKYEGVNWDNDLQKAKGSPEFADSYKHLDFNIDDYLKNKLEADGYTAKKSSIGDGYIYENKTTGEILTPEKAFNAAKSYLESRPDIKEAINRRMVLNQEGFENSDINNSGYNKDNKLVYGDDWYGKTLKAIVNHRVFSKTGNETEIKNDSLYNQKQQQAYDSAQKEKENEAVTFETSFVRNTRSYASSSYGDYINTYRDNKAKMTALYTEPLKLIPPSKVTPSIQRQIKNGDFSFLVNSNLITSSKAEELKNQYIDLKRNHFIIKNQTIAFNSWAKKKGFKEGQVNEKLYNQFMADTGFKGTNDAPMIMSNDIPGFNKKIQEEGGKVIEANIRRLSVNMETGKGYNQVYETADGKKYMILPSNMKITKAPEGTMVLPAPEDGKITIDYLIKNKLGDLKSNDDGSTSFVTYEGGRAKESRIYGRQFGVIRGTKQGKTELGVPVSIGKNSMILSIDTDQINNNTIKKFLDDPQLKEEYAFTEFKRGANLDQRNIAVKSKDYEYSCDGKGKYYYRDLNVKNSRPVEVDKASEKDKIQRMIYKLAPYQ